MDHFKNLNRFFFISPVLRDVFDFCWKYTVVLTEKRNKTLTKLTTSYHCNDYSIVYFYCY